MSDNIPTLDLADIISKCGLSQNTRICSTTVDPQVLDEIFECASFRLKRKGRKTIKFDFLYTVDNEIVYGNDDADEYMSIAIHSKSKRK